MRGVCGWDYCGQSVLSGSCDYKFEIITNIMDEQGNSPSPHHSHHSSQQQHLHRQDSDEFEDLTTEAPPVVAPVQRPSLDTFEHESALQIIAKIIERSYSRHFIKRLTFAFIQSLKSEPKTIIIAHPNRKWPYQELFQKKQRSNDEQQMLEFVHLCATMIQARFKAYITQKRHKQALQRTKNAHQKLVAFVRMWKAYRVYNCRRCFMERAEIKRIEQLRDAQEQNFTTRDPKRIKQLYKHHEIKTQMFRDGFYLLMNSGAWTLEDNMRPKKRHTRQPRRHRQFQVAPSRPQFSPQATHHIQHVEPVYSDPIKQNLDSNNYFENNPSTTFSSFAEDRPIKAKGQYVLNEAEPQAFSSKPAKKSKPKQEEQVEEEQQQRKEEVKREMKKREKRQKYDPRKAIEEQKRRKMEQKHTSNTLEKVEVQGQKKVEVKRRVHTEDSQIADLQNESSVSKKAEPLKKKKIAVSKPPNQKKVTSKVDCWVSKKEEEADWVKECKMRLIEENKKRIEQGDCQEEGDNRVQNQRMGRQIAKFEADERRTREKFRESERKRWTRPREQEFQSSVEKEPAARINNWQRAQLQTMKEKHQEITVNRKSSAHNLQEQVRTLVERNMAKKRESHRTIEELEDAHAKHYGDRFTNLMPKLSLLAVARDEQRDSGIPVLDNDNEEFGEWFHNIFSSTQFWNLASQLERVYKSFVLQ